MQLPEKEYFTLDEILQRWRYAGIDHATLLKLATDDLLVFSVYIRDLGSHTSTRELADARITTDVSVAFSFRNPERSRPPLQYLQTDEARRLLESRSSERIRVQGTYSLPSRTKESGLGYFSEAPLFSRDDLLISRSERDRFESSHSLRLQPPWYSRAWAWLGDQVNQRVLIMLSGWLFALIPGAWALWLWWQQAPTAATPNPSLERTATGKALGPPAGEVDHQASVPSALPAAAPQLKR